MVTIIIARFVVFLSLCFGFPQLLLPMEQNPTSRISSYPLQESTHLQGQEVFYVFTHQNRPFGVNIIDVQPHNENLKKVLHIHSHRSVINYQQQCFMPARYNRFSLNIPEQLPTNISSQKYIEMTIVAFYMNVGKQVKASLVLTMQNFENFEAASAGLRSY